MYRPLGRFSSPEATPGEPFVARAFRLVGIDLDAHLVECYSGGIDAVLARHLLENSVQFVLADGALQPTYNKARDAFVMLRETFPQHLVNIYFHRLAAHVS